MTGNFNDFFFQFLIVSRKGNYKIYQENRKKFEIKKNPDLALTISIYNSFSLNICQKLIIADQL